MLTPQRLHEEILKQTPSMLKECATGFARPMTGKIHRGYQSTAPKGDRHVINIRTLGLDSSLCPPSEHPKTPGAGPDTWTGDPNNGSAGADPPSGIALTLAQP